MKGHRASRDNVPAPGSEQPDVKCETTTAFGYDCIYMTSNQSNLPVAAVQAAASLEGASRFKAMESSPTLTALGVFLIIRETDLGHVGACWFSLVLIA